MPVKKSFLDFMLEQARQSVEESAKTSYGMMMEAPPESGINPLSVGKSALGGLGVVGSVFDPADRLKGNVLRSLAGGDPSKVANLIQDRPEATESWKNIFSDITGAFINPAGQAMGLVKSASLLPFLAKLPKTVKGLSSAAKKAEKAYNAASHSYRVATKTKAAIANPDIGIAAWALAKLPENDFGSFSKELARKGYSPKEAEQLWKPANAMVSLHVHQTAGQLSGYDRLMELLQRGDRVSEGRAKTWYEDAQQELVRVFGEEEGPLVGQFLAATSSNRNVPVNMQLAMKAYARWKAGHGIQSDIKIPGIPATGQTGTHAKALKAAEESRPLSGPKVGPFAGAMSGDPHAVVQDMWISRAMGIGDSPSDLQRPFVDAAIRDIAEDLGQDPRQVQAQIWTGVLDEWMEAGKTDRLDSTSFADLLHEKSFTTIAYELDFGKFSKLKQEYPGFHDLPYHQKQVITEHVLTKITDDILKDVNETEKAGGYGAQRAYTMSYGSGSGAWGETVNPGGQLTLLAPEPVVDDVMDILGGVLEQDMMFAYRADKGRGKPFNTLAVAQTGGAKNLADPRVMADFWKRLGELEPELYANLGSTPMATGPGFRIVNSEYYFPVSERERIVAHVNQVAEEMGMKTDGAFHHSTPKVSVAGEGGNYGVYFERVAGRARPAVRKGLGRYPGRLKAHMEEALELYDPKGFSRFSGGNAPESAPAQEIIDFIPGQGLKKVSGY